MNSKAPAALALVAALDLDHAIGRGNALPWHLPDDLRRFKRLTLGHPVLMGRKTTQSIGRALPGRPNLVLSRSTSAPYPEQTVVSSIEQARRLAGPGPLFVIGGGEVYRQCLALASALHLTWVETRIADADTWFPRFDPGEWSLQHESRHPADDRHAHAFRFVDYQRL